MNLQENFTIYAFKPIAAYGSALPLSHQTEIFSLLEFSPTKTTVLPRAYTFRGGGRVLFALRTA